jgi:glycosyltransferase involved in cell wall biosynthesis
VINDIAYDSGSTFKISTIFTLSYKSATSPIRVFNWFLFMFGLLVYCLFNFINRPKVIIYSSPSLIPYLAAWIISRLIGAKLILDVRDLWPSSFIDVIKVKKYNPLILIHRLIEKFAYNTSDVLVSCLPGFSDLLSADKKMKSFYIPTCHINLTKFDNNIYSYEHVMDHNDFNLVYVGGMGPAHDLGVLLEAALLLRDRSNIKFHLIGDGASFYYYKKIINKFSLNNVHLLGRLKKSHIKYFFENSNILYMGWKNHDIYRYGIGPNKLSEYLSYNKPILNSYSGRYDPIETNGCGWTVPSGSPRALSLAILNAINISESEMDNIKNNTKSFFDKDFSAQSFLNKWSDAIRFESKNL